MPTTGELLREGIRLYQAGEKRQAARVLAALLKQEPKNEQAWWWLAACVDTPEQKRDCLVRVLRINPEHNEARMTLLREFGTAPFHDLFPAAFEKTAPLRLSQPGANSHGAPSGGEARAAPSPLEQSLTQARAAEWASDYLEAYRLYDQALQFDASSTEAWLGKGYAAARLSNAENNGFPEFFNCLSRAILTKDRLGLPVQQAINRLEPDLASAVTTRLVKLLDFSEGLVASSPPPMANVYAVERAHLADWAYTAGKNGSSALALPRARLTEIALQSLEVILTNVLRTTRSARARREMMVNFKSFMLSNLATSGLNRDTGFLRQMDQVIEQRLSG